MKFLLGVLILLTGCAVPQANISNVRTLVYDCGGGYRFTVRDEGEGLWLFLPSGTRQLPHLPAASGARYADAEVEFWSKGEEALLNIQGQDRRKCQSDRVAAIWEDAKFRGVDFRAAGNEPGWFLELDREKIVYVGEYGKQMLTFPYVSPQINDHRAQSSYSSVSNGHKLNVLLQAGDCHDNMSGRGFETRVTLELDGRTLYGCGQSLH